MHTHIFDSISIHVGIQLLYLFFEGLNIMIILLFHNQLNSNNNIDMFILLLKSCDNTKIFIVSCYFEKKYFYGVMSKSRRDKRKEHEYELTGQSITG